MSSRALSDLPDPAKEAEKCRNFLSQFVDEHGDPKYKNQLQSIAHRESKVLLIELDDVLWFNNDSDFVSNIERNTMRYVQYFEEEADKLLPPPPAFVSSDVFDVLEAQRIASLQRAAERGQSVTEALGLPRALLRRFQVLIYPRSAAKARKLREVRAEDIGHLVVVKGLVVRASSVRPRAEVLTYTCEVCGSEIFQPLQGAAAFMPVLRCESRRCLENKSAGKLTLQTRGSKFVKFQELKLQELPDQLPMGHVPRSTA
eukprot:gene45566-55771_t